VTQTLPQQGSGPAKERDEAVAPPSILEDPQRRGAERSEAPRSGGASKIERLHPQGVAPDPHVSKRPLRRRFTAEFKLQVLREADRCTEAGQIGALLRRHGLYSSLLSTWRRERDRVAKVHLSRKRGRKPAPVNPLSGRLAQLEREHRALQARMRKAEIIIDVQKKVSALLGIPLNTPDDDESGS
jgi:transposase